MVLQMCINTQTKKPQIVNNFIFLGGKSVVSSTPISSLFVFVFDVAVFCI